MVGLTIKLNITCSPTFPCSSINERPTHVRQICAKYGVPYVRENIVRRVKKMFDIMVGNTSMPWFPEAYAQAFLRKDAEMLEMRSGKPKKEG